MSLFSKKVECSFKAKAIYPIPSVPTSILRKPTPGLPKISLIVQITTTSTLDKAEEVKKKNNINSAVTNATVYSTIYIYLNSSPKNVYLLKS